MSLASWIYIGIFLLAVIHSVMASRHHTTAIEDHSWKAYLQKTEVIFVFWALIFCLLLFSLEGVTSLISYLQHLSFIEPLFVSVIIVVAGAKPVLTLIELLLFVVIRKLPFSPFALVYLMTLAVIPLSGSLITEPAAITLSALLLKKVLNQSAFSERFNYATLATLFVNISIGGALTPFAAPPILMVAHTWHWDTWYTFSTFAPKVIPIVFMTTLINLFLFRHQWKNTTTHPFSHRPQVSIPLALIHLAFILLIMHFSHEPKWFMLGFLLFYFFTNLTKNHQNPLIIHEGLLVGLFLSALIIMGNKQQIWLCPLLQQLDNRQIFFGASALTAITDNAALTYLASLMPTPNDAFKLNVVGGALAGGGLTVIANAPNPAGAALLQGVFRGSIKPLQLLQAALLPTCITLIIFSL